METVKNNKKIVIIVIAAVVCIAAVIGIIAVSSHSNKIYGSWEVSEQSLDEDLGGYPEKNFVMYDNGTFAADGISGTFSMDEDTITFTFSMLGYYTYEYDLSGDTLMLRNIEEEDAPTVYYDRVS